MSARILDRKGLLRGRWLLGSNRSLDLSASFSYFFATAFKRTFNRDL